MNTIRVINDEYNQGDDGRLERGRRLEKKWAVQQQGKDAVHFREFSQAVTYAHLAAVSPVAAAGYKFFVNGLITRAQAKTDFALAGPAKGQ